MTTGDQRERRQELLKGELRANWQRQHGSEVRADLGEEIGVDLSRAVVLDPKESAGLAEAAVATSKYHSVWHRIWGARLQNEMLIVANALADRLEGRSAFWLEAIQAAGAFEVPVAATLRAIAPMVGTSGPSVHLATRGAESGLSLRYEHWPNADEFELYCWGDYAFPMDDL